MHCHTIIVQKSCIASRICSAETLQCTERILINTNISRISPESTPIQEGIDKEAGGAAEACQACAAGTPVHQAELGPAGTHLSALLDRGAGCRSRWYMNHSGWLTGDNASRQKQPEIAIDDCRGSIGGAIRELAGGGD